MNMPIFVISDLHIGAGGKTDTFSQCDRSSSFESFLDYVVKEGGELIILGDFLDLWKFTLRKIIKTRIGLLDRLAEMKVCCIPGNHDQAFKSFLYSENVPHRFFRKIKQPFERTIGGKKFTFLHGHELDPVSRKITHHFGRVLGLSSSLVEYAVRYPVFSSDTIEETLSGLEEKLFLAWFNFMAPLTNIERSPYSAILQNPLLLPRQKRIEKLLVKYELKKQIDGSDITVSAHTHRPCRFQNWYFNSGSWTGLTNNFIQILPNGRVDIFDWEKDAPVSNHSVVQTSGSASKFKNKPFIC